MAKSPENQTELQQYLEMFFLSLLLYLPVFDCQCPQRHSVEWRQ